MKAKCDTTCANACGTILESNSHHHYQLILVNIVYVWSTKLLKTSSSCGVQSSEKYQLILANIVYVWSTKLRKMQMHETSYECTCTDSPPSHKSHIISIKHHGSHRPTTRHVTTFLPINIGNPSFTSSYFNKFLTANNVSFQQQPTSIFDTKQHQIFDINNTNF